MSDRPIADTEFYLSVLTSNECRCGRYKKERKAVCYTCWLLLPNHLQIDLYAPMRQGFEEAYEAVVDYLDR